MKVKVKRDGKGKRGGGKCRPEVLMKASRVVGMFNFVRYSMGSSLRRFFANVVHNDAFY